MGNKRHTLRSAGLRPQRAEFNTKPLRLTCRSCDLKTFPAARLTVNVSTSGRAGTPSLCCLVVVVQEIYHLRVGTYLHSTLTQMCVVPAGHTDVLRSRFILFFSAEPRG